MTATDPEVQLRLALVETLEAARSGRYYVCEAVDWLAHEYQQHPYPVQVAVILETLGGVGDTDALLVLTAGSRMKPDASWRDRLQATADLKADLRAAIASVERLRVQNQNQDEPVVFRIDWRGARVSEWYDVEHRVRGVDLQVQVSY